MVIKLNIKIIFVIICALIILAVCLHVLFSASSPPALVAGGVVHPAPHIKNDALPALSLEGSLMSERFHRPSKEYPYPNPFSFKDFYKDDDNPPLITDKFNNPESAILVFYGILREASNMLGYSGGCGTVGESTLPYPYAYELLTDETKKGISLNEFIDSFQGCGYISLLKMLPAYSPPGTPKDLRYYMIEIELITGYNANNEDDYNKGSLFAYYYGLITVEQTNVEQTNNAGWKIKSIDYIPEGFLCAPTHGWFYLADSVVMIVYGNNLKMIERIDKIEQKGSMVYVYASGNGKSYRFDFVRITNGYDILLHENILKDGSWKETALLPDEWSYIKLTINNSMLKKAV